MPAKTRPASPAQSRLTGLHRLSERKISKSPRVEKEQVFAGCKDCTVYKDMSRALQFLQLRTHDQAECGCAWRYFSGTLSKTARKGLRRLSRNQKR
jgi:hypothetical protein